MGLFSRGKSDKQTSKAPAPDAADLVGSGDEVFSRSAIEHRDFLLSKVRGGRPFGIGLWDINGLTLCESLSSDIDLPLFTAATVDGWAVRASNLVGASVARPISLPVVDFVYRADRIPEPLTPGTAVRIAAGAPVPEGADAVVPLAAAKEVEGGVNFSSEIPFHQHLLLAGSRIAEGNPLLASGTVLNPRLIALLAEVGNDKVLALPKPRVIVGAVGADLLEPGKPLTRLTQRYDATTAMITSAIRAAGAHAFPIGILSSNTKELVASINEQLVAADLILLMTDATETASEALAKLGEVDSTEIEVSPAGPSIFALVGEQRIPVLVLPSNTVSAYVAYEVFALPLVRKLAGVDPLERESVSVLALQGIPADPINTQFILGYISDEGVTPIKTSAEAGGVELAQANAIIVVNPGLPVINGQTAICWLLDQ